MKVSLKQVVRFAHIELPPVAELVDRINQQLGGVEEVIDIADKYKDAKIVRIVSAEKHPNADRLRVCQIDAGSEGLVQVVCGAPNARADMWAVWLPPAATVPASYGDAEPFVLSARELRGVMSNGMLAAGDELDLNDDHEGIIELTDYDLPEGASLVPGASFAEVFGLDDTIIDIENKMFTHRPDLFGQLGVAREIAAILGEMPSADEAATADARFENPDWYWRMPEFTDGSGADLSVYNDTPEKVPRAVFLTLQDVIVRPSPLWLQCELVAMGAKPINNVVDATNYAMLITAQPTHAYDYAKIRGGTIGARQARAGEETTLLNGKTYQLDADDIVIADAEGVIALGGIMGGLESEVSNETTTVILEVATFDMYAVRKTSMRHGLFTDALTRFNKGQSSLQNTRVMQYLSQLLQSLAGAHIASPLYDTNEELAHKESVHGEIRMTTEFVTDRLGVELTTDQIGNLLRRVNFALSLREDAPANEWYVAAPYWRTDIELPEDVVEEVGRLYGFDKLPVELPQRQAAPAPLNESIRVKQSLRRALTAAGGNEVLTYSFVHERTLKKANQSADEAWKLGNALSPDLQYYRLSLVPSLLDKVHSNVRAGYDEFMLYEIGKTHHAKLFGEDGLPAESARVAGVYVSPSEGATFYQAKHALEYALRQAAPAVELRYVRADESAAYESLDLALRQSVAPYDRVRSAIVYIDDMPVGVVGELKPSVRRDFKLPEHCAAFEVDIAPLLHQRELSYRPLSKFPSTQRDVSYEVTAETTYERIADAARQALGSSELLEVNVACDIELQAIYRAENSDTKTVTMRYTLTPADKTLQADEANDFVAVLSAQIMTATNAHIA